VEFVAFVFSFCLPLLMHNLILRRVRHGRDRLVVGFTIT